MMKKALLLFLCIGLVIGCIYVPPKYLTDPTPEERLYIEKIKTHSLEFEIPKAEAQDAWGRAQAFIGQYSSMKIQTVTDYVIETYNPVFDAYARKFGYSVTKTPMGDNVKITVRCIGEPPVTTSGEPFPTIELNARILANYIKSGELPYPHLIDR